MKQDYSDDDWTIKKVTSAIHDIEERLLNPNTESLEAWYDIRFNVFMKLTNLLGLYGVSHGGIRDISKITKLKNKIDRYFLWVIKNPFKFIFKKNSYIFIGSSRRKKIDSYYYDIYTDPITLDLFKDRSITLEKKYEGKHLHPVKTKNLAYLERLFILEKFFWHKRNPDVPQNIRHMFQHLEKEFYTVFNIKIEIEKIGSKRYVVFKKRQFIIEIFFKYIKPKLVFIVCSYGKEYLIRAAKNLNITTIELQHGVITKYHLGYNFLESLPKKSFPDYFFMFGDYWKTAAMYPIKQDKIITIGYPFFEGRLNELDKLQKKEQVVFISQGIIGHYLSKFAVEYAENNNKYVIIYKLHPGEINNWELDYPWLRKAEIEGKLKVLVGLDVDLYKILAESMIQIGVNSTALFEGIRLHCKTYIVNLPGVEYMNDLIESGYVNLVNDVSELLSIEDHAVKDNIGLKIFSKDWKKNFMDTLKEKQLLY